MSWDIWISCFRNGDVGNFAREIFDRAFKDITCRNRYGSLSLVDCNGTIYVDDKPELGGLSTNRPPAPDHPFWPALIDVLKQTTCVLYWPGKGCVVADKSVIPHISADFDKAVGTPTVTTDIGKIFELMENA